MRPRAAAVADSIRNVVDGSLGLLTRRRSLRAFLLDERASGALGLGLGQSLALATGTSPLLRSARHVQTSVRRSLRTGSSATGEAGKLSARGIIGIQREFSPGRDVSGMGRSQARAGDDASPPSFLTAQFFPRSLPAPEHLQRLRPLFESLNAFVFER